MKDVKRGEIYYADLRPTQGSEQGGIRPVLVLQNDVGNKFSPTTIIAAITSRTAKSELPTHVAISPDCLKEDSIVLLEQIRTIDKRRLQEYVGFIDREIMERVTQAMVTSLDIKTLEAKPSTIVAYCRVATAEQLRGAVEG